MIELMVDRKEIIAYVSAVRKVLRGMDALGIQDIRIGNNLCIATVYYATTTPS